MNNKGMFYTNVDDYETKEDMMNDFIALRMYDMAKDKEIERLNKELEKRTKQYENVLKRYQELENKNAQTEYNNKKAIEYIETQTKKLYKNWDIENFNFEELSDILKGGKDNE